MARQRRNPQGDDGQRSPAGEEQKKNDSEAQDDGPNGVDRVFAKGNGGEVYAGGNSGGVQAGNNARGMARNLASMVAMLGKMWAPQLQTGLAKMWI